MFLQTRDLILESGKSTPKLCFGAPECFIELVQEKVDNPLEFVRVLKAAFQSQRNDTLKINVSHLYDLNSLPRVCTVVLYIGLMFAVCFCNLYDKLLLIAYFH